MQTLWKGLVSMPGNKDMVNRTWFRSFCADCEQIKVWNLVETWAIYGLVAIYQSEFLISIVLKNTKGTKLCTHLRESFDNHSFYDILRKFTEKLSSAFSNELVTNFFSWNSGGITGIFYCLKNILIGTNMVWGLFGGYLACLPCIRNNYFLI